MKILENNFKNFIIFFKVRSIHAFYLNNSFFLSSITTERALNWRDLIE